MTDTESATAAPAFDTGTVKQLLERITPEIAWIEWQREDGGNWWRTDGVTVLRWARNCGWWATIHHDGPSTQDLGLLGRAVHEEIARDEEDPDERGPVAPAFEVARVGALLSRELPPGSWVEWSETDGDDVTWFCATADDRHFWRFESRWMARGNSDLNRSALRLLGRLVPAGSDPDPTSRGPITGGVS